MIQDEIIRMVREAEYHASSVQPFTIDVGVPNGEWILARDTKLATLVAAAEREACARVCEGKHSDGRGHDAWGWISKDYAEAIRARGQP